MIGIVLCGGRSTRFPHKLFLCDKKGLMLPKACVHLLHGLGFETYCAINSGDAVLRGILSPLTKFVVDDHDGVVPLLVNLSKME